MEDRTPRPTRRGALGLLAGAAAGLAAPALQANSPAVYRFSPVNQYGISLTAAYWNPILQHVSDRSGVKLQLKIGRTSADTTAYVLAQEVEFVFSNHLFSPDRERMGWRAIARRQTPPIHSQILVFAESPHARLDELRGLEIAFPGPEALVAYKFSAAHLMAQGIEFKAVFGGNMDGAFAQLAAGKAAAVGANSQLAEGYARREARAFRSLWTSPPLHDLALMVAAKVPEGVRRAVGQAFTGMLGDHKGRDVLAQASALVGLPSPAGFIPSDGSEYAVYREFYRTAPLSLR